ncbi:hypothetical protein ABIA39_007529 [Nocardia sp. GAS34]|uniref:hypothetical protein n=1 Tax=unclassified Nocardia TaxID=2637762 RepID=UPI003D1B87AF
MNWPRTRPGITDPEHYRHIAEQTVRELRAGFAHHHLLHKTARFGETAEQTAQYKNWATELDTQWSQHPHQRLRQMWADLHPVVELWERHPELARQIADQLARACTAGDLSPDSDLWNTWEQARELTGHSHPAPTGSEQDGYRHYPQPDLEPAATRTTDRAALPGPDRRSAVDKTLGAPRTPAPLLNPDQVADVISSTTDVLTVETFTARADERELLLPPVLRGYPTVESSSRVDDLQARLLQQIQNLAAEHAHEADGFTGVQAEEQRRIDRLDRIGSALSQARADAIEAGVTQQDTDRAYRTGRDGNLLPLEPTEPGFEQPTGPLAQRFPGGAPDWHDAAPAASRVPGAGRGGMAITAAVQDVLPSEGTTDWDQSPQQPCEPSSAQVTEVAP